jgi:ribosomal protein S18 acetylase RimI-like enzyme
VSALDFTIRSLEPADQEFLREMLYIALWDPSGTSPRPRSILDHPRIARYIQEWGTEPHDLGFVACLSDGTPIGVVWSRLLLPPEEGGAFFDSETPELGIAVLPEFHRRGVGTALLAHHLQAASTRFRAVSLGVHPENPARLLYQKFGFTRFAFGGGGYWNMVLAFT